MVVDLTSPTVSSLATVPGPRSTPVATEDVTFSKPINPATLSANDVTLTLNGGSNLITADVTIAFVSGNTYQINGLAALTAAPARIRSPSTLRKSATWPAMPASGSLSTTWVFNASIPASPTNLAISPDTGNSATDGITDTGTLTLTGSLSTAGLTVDVFDATANTDLGDATVTGTTFSLPIQLAAGTHQLLVTDTDSSNNSSPPSTFTVDVITTPPAAPASLAISPNTGTTAGLTDTGEVTLTGALAATGLAVDVFDATANVDLGAATVTGTTFSLALNLAAGTHQLRVTATDLAGNVSSPALFTVVVDQTPPTATLAAVTSPRNTAVATEEVNFSEPINPATLNDNDLTLTLDGGSNLITSAVSITPVSGNTYQINGLGSLTAADGTYALAVNPSAIANLAGNPGTGPASVSWVMDTVPPTLSLAPISVPRTTPVATEDITFSKPINPATLNSNDFTLTFNGGPNLITAAVTISPVSGNIYQINGLAPLTATHGTYTLTVNATDISDLAGNAGVGSLSTSWVVSSNAPASPTNLAISPNTGVSPGLTDTGSVTLTGSLAATGLAVDVFDATANVDLGAATVTGTTFSLALSLVAGTHQLRVMATDLAGNVSSPALFTVVVDQTPPTATLAAVTSPRNTAVATEEVNFSEPINPATLTWQVLSLTLNGGPNLITSSNITITPVAGSTYDVNGLAGLTTAEGTYSLTVNAAGIADSYGNPGSGTLSTSWLMDTTPPTSTVGSLPVQTTSTSFLVSASGTDPNGSNGSTPSGIASFTLYVSEDGGAFTPFATVTPANPSALFTGQPGHNYGFYSIATDNAGNVQPTPLEAQATTEVVSAVDTTTSLQSSEDPSKLGDPVTFTATVSPDQTTNGTPTGSVQFSIDGATVGNPVPLDANGLATLTTSSLAVGSHTVAASYVNADGNFNDSSTTLAGGQIVTTADTTVSVGSSAMTSVFGQSVTFTVNVSAVTAGLPTPTGTVELFDGATELGTASLNGGGATYSTVGLAVGSHAITAQYLGDGNFSGSTSPVVSQTVGQAGTTTSVAASPSSSVYG